MTNINLRTLLLTGASLLAAPGIVAAQTASQVTKPNYAPTVVRPASGGIVLPASSGLEAPAGAASLSVVPAGLVVENGLPALSEETAAIDARLRNKRVTGADLFTAARDLEAAYARAGYLLARVVLPPQTLKNGQPLRLVVVQGRIGTVDTSGVEAPARQRIAAIVAPLADAANPSRAEIERRLLLAGDTPGISLRSALKSGGKPGEADLILSGKTRPFSYSIDADNSTSSVLGHGTLGFGVDANNLLGLGEVGYLRASGYPAAHGDLAGGDPRNRQLVAGATVPIGTDGWWANIEAVDSRTHPTSDLDYTIPDHYQRLSGRLGWSWLRSRDMNAGTSLSYDITDETQQIDLDGERSDFSKDQLRVLRLNQTFDMVTARGDALSANATASFGLDGLGARSATDDLPLSRDGATPDFTKLAATGRYAGAFASGQVALNIAGTAQTAFGDALASSEQLGIGGFGWLSAFDSSALQGDAGAALRAELAFPKAIPMQTLAGVGAQATPYVFGAAGFVTLAQPTAVEDSFSRAGALGLGLKVALDAPGDTARSASLSLEYAHGAGSGDLRDDRMNVTFGLRF